jgi:hypothetical protein
MIPHGRGRKALPARATATGLELARRFDRPLAFGCRAVTRRAASAPGSSDEQNRIITRTTSTGLAPPCEAAP